MSIPQPFVFYPLVSAPINWGPIITGASWRCKPWVPILDCTGYATIYEPGLTYNSDGTPNGTPVTGATNLSFELIDSVNAIYQAQIPGPLFAPVFGTGYTTYIFLISSSTGFQRPWSIPTIIAQDSNS